MFKGNNKELTKKFMNGKLTIKVGKEYGNMWAHVTYKDEFFVLPGALDNLYKELAKAVNYNYDTAKVIYELIERETNQMLTQYQMKEARMNVVQFQFPPAIVPITTCTTHIGATPIPNFDWASQRIERITWSDAGSYGPHYLSMEEFEKMREEGRLVSGASYVVMN